MVLSNERNQQVFNTFHDLNRSQLFIKLFLSKLQILHDISMHVDIYIYIFFLIFIIIYFQSN